MNLGVKRIRHLPRRPGKENQPVARRNLFHRESVPLQPRRNPRHVLPAHPKPRPILLRRQPLVKQPRPRIVLRLHQRIQLRLLRGRWLQLQHHPPQRRLTRHHPLVKIPPRQRMHVAHQRHHLPLIDRPRHPAHRPLRHTRRTPHGKPRQSRQIEGDSHKTPHLRPFKTRMIACDQGQPFRSLSVFSSIGPETPPPR